LVADKLFSRINLNCLREADCFIYSSNGFHVGDPGQIKAITKQLGRLTIFICIYIVRGVYRKYCM